jgi:hypothetical protein
MCKGYYSPKIREDLIPVLYRLAKEEKRPMTKVVDQILREGLDIRGLIDYSHGSSTGRDIEGHWKANQS